MKNKLLLFLSSIIIAAVLLPSFASASNWLLFALSKQTGTNWHYDKESIVYLKAKSIAGVELPRKDRNYPKVWIKSTGDKGEFAYQVELNCKGRTARLQDESGKTLYSQTSIDYLYDRPILPDSVLDMLRKTVCR